MDTEKLLSSLNFNYCRRNCRGIEGASEGREITFGTLRSLFVSHINSGKKIWKGEVHFGL